MKKSELKAIIKECLLEMLFEEKGILSNVIEEVIKAQGKTLVTESKQTQDTRKMIKNMYSEEGLLEALTPANKLQQQKRNTPENSKLVKEVSKQFGGFNPFEGTSPLED